MIMSGNEAWNRNVLDAGGRLTETRRFDWATENAGFDAKVQRNLGLDCVTKQHESLQKLLPVYSLV